ncbi:MAG: transporter substrate-binding domain-containing protein [Azonexus sp.]|nr:transporter substrate-binding domain-containing protein [Betaproteobacteria bacterium]MBK8918538.1 transporter substrate-binding domain-containing protein [Betaproteobacteria bacterium]MBP6035516.1 transporter substrate-binding domain-containing protein [Azonexus sp.]MBP6906360.1 transporter substrate-binding domain-containing protein [Azonexus sp.]
MSSDRRLWLKAIAALPLAGALPAAATDLEGIRKRGRLRIAVYNDFPPYSKDAKGIDADIGRALAEKLGLTAEVVGFNADEDMNDDLRNMVWKGHYLGTQPADVMMHVPVDEHLARQNDKVRIFAPYHRETIAVARDPAKVQKLVGSAAVALEVFTREKVGVEIATLSDHFLLAALNGRLRENVAHFKSHTEAAKALANGQIAAIMGPRTELEAVMQGQSKFVVDAVEMPELRVSGWSLGMAVKAEEMELAAALTRAVSELKADGTLAAIFKRHNATYQPG